MAILSSPVSLVYSQMKAPVMNTRNNRVEPSAYDVAADAKIDAPWKKMSADPITILLVVNFIINVFAIIIALAALLSRR